MPPTKAGRNGLVFQFEADPSQLVKALGRVANDLGELEKAFVKTQKSSAKYIEDVTKSLKELATVSGRLPAVAKGLSGIFDAIDNLRVNQNKATYITGISSSLSKLTGPLQLLTTVNAGPAITNLGSLFDTVSSKVPTNTQIERLDSFAKALRNFNSASKGLANLPPATLAALSAVNARNIFGGGGGGGTGPGGGGGRGGGGDPLVPLTLPGGTGGAPVNLPAFGGTGVHSPTPTGMAKAGMQLGNYARALKGTWGIRTVLAAPLIKMLDERTDVNEQLGTVANFGLGLGGAAGAEGSSSIQYMMDKSAMMHGISYRDAASLMASYRKYGSGDLYQSGITDMARGTKGQISNSYEGYVAGSRRLQRQLGIDLDEAGDIQGSTRKNLQMNADQFKSFGDAMVYLSRNTAMSKKEVIDLSKEVQTMGVVTGKSGEGAKTFSQDMMVAAGTLSQAGVSGGALTSIQKGFTGDMTNYMLNKQMGITSAMRPQEQVMMQQQFISSRLESLSGMDPETRNLMIRMMQSKGLLPADMDLTDIYKEGRLDPAKLKSLVDDHSDKIKKEQFVQGQGMKKFFGSVGSVLQAAPSALVNIFSSTGSDQPLQKKAAGGIVSGSGESDSVPAMLTPGEEVLRKDDPRHRDNINLFAKSIARIEGYYAEGDSPNRPQRNYNPGNLRVAGWSDRMDPEAAMRMARIQGAVGYDKGGYLKFANEESGFAGLKRQIQIDAKRGLNVSQFVSKYAPATENNTANYLAFMNKQGFNSSTVLSDITGGSFERVAAPMQATSAATGGLLNRVSSTFSSVGNSITSFLGDLFDFSNNMSSAVSKTVQGNTAQVSASLLGVSSSNSESADKISQAADVLLQAAQTMSSAVVSQASRGSEEQRYRIASFARGNMVF